METSTDQVIALTAYSTVFKHGVLACTGAVAHAIQAHRTGRSKGLLDFILLSIMSSFSGVVFALLALNTFQNEYITLASAGIGGFLGVEGLTMISGKLKDSISQFIK